MFNLKLTAGQKSTTSTLAKSSVQISEFQQTLKTETEVVFAVSDEKETIWTDKVMLSPYGSNSLNVYIEASLLKNGVPASDVNRFLFDLYNAPIQKEAQAKFDESKEEKRRKQTVTQSSEYAEAEKMDRESSIITAQAGKKAIGVIASWQVVLIVLVLPLIDLSALMTLFVTLHYQNAWVIGLVVIVSGLLLVWYLSKVIKASQRKVLEDTITKEVFIYVGREQLKQREKVAKQLQVYDDLFGNSNLKRLATADGANSAEQLLEEMAVLQDESTL